MNRIARYFDNSREEAPGDYFIVVFESGYAYVSRETATRLEALLGRWFVPRWVVFHDCAGSRIRMRASHIRSVCESTASQRAADRRFERAREREEQDDRRPWEDGD